MTYSVIGHGSFFEDAEDPKDVDVVIVTDEDLPKEAAAARVLPLLDGRGDLPLDVSVYHPDTLGVFERAIALHGRQLDGDNITADLKPVRPLDWCLALLEVADGKRKEMALAEAALAAVGCILAAEGRIVVGKARITAAAAGGRWESLAAAAWEHRADPSWHHADLASLFREVEWAPAGEAACEEWEATGMSSKENRCAFATVWRGFLTPDEVSRLATVETTTEREGGWTKDLVDDEALTTALHTAAAVANLFWFGHCVAGIEPIELHRYPAGSTFPKHVDKCPMFPTRVANVVALIQPASVGGRLFFELGDTPSFPDLEPGDLIVFDGSMLHGVTKVAEGERVTLVTHLHCQAR